MSFIYSDSMRLIKFLLLFSFLYQTVASAEVVLACKKRNPYVYQSFYWVQIERNEKGQLAFFYGNGVDSQMVEVYFASTVTASAPVTPGIQNYSFQNEAYSLSADVNTNARPSLLKFTIKNKTQTVVRDHFVCE